MLHSLPSMACLRFGGTEQGQINETVGIPPLVVAFHLNKKRIGWLELAMNRARCGAFPLRLNTYYQEMTLWKLSLRQIPAEASTIELRLS